MTRIPAIRTKYKGIQMRSRLEARWAAFFDNLPGVTWRYEPMETNGWIPDFTVDHASLPLPLLVEIKPIGKRSPADAAILHDAQTKAERALGLPAAPLCHRLVVVGNDPGEVWAYTPGIGWNEDHVTFANNWQAAWNIAGNRTMWAAPVKESKAPKSTLPADQLLPITARDLIVADVCGPMIKAFLSSLTEEQKRRVRATKRYHPEHQVHTELPAEMYLHPLFHDTNRAIRALVTLLVVFPNADVNRALRNSPATVQTIASLWEISPKTFEAIMLTVWCDCTLQGVSQDIQRQIAARTIPAPPY